MDRNGIKLGVEWRNKPSLSARRAWIEIRVLRCAGADRAVALRKESVDRNNPVIPAKNRYIAVALRKESVDRNSIPTPHHPQLTTSLSARRAWIEISDSQGALHQFPVALRKESVDRNDELNVMPACKQLSLSARRAWIEIYTPDEEFVIDEVALRKESVDRNYVQKLIEQN